MNSDLATIARARTGRSFDMSMRGPGPLVGSGPVPEPKALSPYRPYDLSGAAPSAILSPPQDADDRDPESTAGGGDRDAAVPAFRFLLLEDDAVDVRLIRACAGVVGSLRLTCEVVTSVAAARERVASGAFDLCITDFWLGCESSLGFVAEMSRSPLAVPVIVLTSLSTPEIRHLCLQAGAARVIGKENLSPGILASTVAEAMRDGGAAAAALEDPGALPKHGLDFLGDFARIMRPPAGTASPSHGTARPERDLRPLQTSTRAFASLSETARLAVLEQIAAVAARTAGSMPEEGGADLVEAVAKACSLVEGHSRQIAFDRPAWAFNAGCDEPALIFLAYEVLSRVSAVTAERMTIGVDLRREDGGCALHVSGPAYGGMSALPVTFGALFASILRCCGCGVDIVHDPGRSITLVARFPDASVPPANPRSH